MLEFQGNFSGDHRSKLESDYFSFVLLCIQFVGAITYRSIVVFFLIFLSITVFQFRDN